MRPTALFLQGFPRFLHHTRRSYNEIVSGGLAAKAVAEQAYRMKRTHREAPAPALAQQARRMLLSASLQTGPAVDSREVARILDAATYFGLGNDCALIRECIEWCKKHDKAVETEVVGAIVMACSTLHGDTQARAEPSRTYAVQSASQRSFLLSSASSCARPSACLFLFLSSLQLSLSYSITMNLEANNIETDLDRPLGDIVKGMKKEKRKERRNNNKNKQDRQGRSNQRGRGLTYARRAPAGPRGGHQRRDHGRQRQYVEIAPQRYRYAPRYVEYPRYAPVYVTRARGPRRYAYEPHPEYRHIEEEPIRVRYEEIPREDIRVQGTARMPRVVDRVDANRARRRQAVERRRQENRGSNSQKQQTAKN